MAENLFVFLEKDRRNKNKDQFEKQSKFLNNKIIFSSNSKIPTAIYGHHACNRNDCHSMFNYERQFRGKKFLCFDIMVILSHEDPNHVEILKNWKKMWDKDRKIHPLKYDTRTTIICLRHFIPEVQDFFMENRCLPDIEYVKKHFQASEIIEKFQFNIITDLAKLRKKGAKDKKLERSTILKSAYDGEDFLILNKALFEAEFKKFELEENKKPLGKFSECQIFFDKDTFKKADAPTLEAFREKIVRKSLAKSFKANSNENSSSFFDNVNSELGDEPSQLETSYTDISELKNLLADKQVEISRLQMKLNEKMTKPTLEEEKYFSF